MTTIQIIGAPGSGKSTVASRLGKALGCPVWSEPFEKNEYIVEIAVGRLKHYECQLKMMELTALQEMEANKSSWEYKVLDGGRLQTLGFVYKFLKDRLISADQYVTLCEYLASTIELQPLPDLVFFLMANSNILKGRVDGRGRDFEANYTREYLGSIQQGLRRAVFNCSPTSKLTLIDASQPADGVLEDILANI